MRFNYHLKEHFHETSRHVKGHGAAVLNAATFPWRWAPAAEGKQQRVLYFTCNVGFYHSVVQRTGDQLSHSERILVELGRQTGIEVTCTKDGRVFDGDLGQYDAFVFYTNGDLTQPNPQNEPPMTAEGKQRFLAAVEAGKGFVGLHSTCNSWAMPRPAYENVAEVDPFLAMLGAQFIGTDRNRKRPCESRRPTSPASKEVGSSFDLLEEWYAMKNFAKDLHVILVQRDARHARRVLSAASVPVDVGANAGPRTRVFHVAGTPRRRLGVQADAADRHGGGPAWPLGNVQADVKPNIDQVTPHARTLKGPA